MITIPMVRYGRFGGAGSRTTNPVLPIGIVIGWIEGRNSRDGPESVSRNSPGGISWYPSHIALWSEGSPSSSLFKLPKLSKRGSRWSWSVSFPFEFEFEIFRVPMSTCSESNAVSCEMIRGDIGDFWSFLMAVGWKFPQSVRSMAGCSKISWWL